MPIKSFIRCDLDAIAAARPGASDVPVALLLTPSIPLCASCDSADQDGYVAALLLRSHLYLCICFGLAQGAAITTITYATTFMNERVGSYCDGVFFGCFTVVSLTIGATGRVCGVCSV